MALTRRNHHWCQGQYHWCIIGVRSTHYTLIFVMMFSYRSRNSDSQLKAFRQCVVCRPDTHPTMVAAIYLFVDRGLGKLESMFDFFPPNPHRTKKSTLIELALLKLLLRHNENYLDELSRH